MPIWIDEDPPAEIKSGTFTAVNTATEPFNIEKLSEARQRRGLTITDLERSADGYWTANVSVTGDTIPVTRQFGAWGTVPDGGGCWKLVKFEIAEALQAEIASIEKAERRALEAKKGINVEPTT